MTSTLPVTAALMVHPVPNWAVRIEHEGQVVVLDPGVFTDPEAVDGATAVLVTHVHPDHLHPENLRATDAPVFTVGQVAEQLAADAPDVAERTTTVATGARVM